MPSKKQGHDVFQADAKKIEDRGIIDCYCLSIVLNG